MFKMKNAFLIILSLIFIGCAPRMTVLLDGKPIPEYSYTLTNPETGIQVQVVAAKWVYVDEDGEKILWPEYIRVGECIDVNPDRALYIGIHIKIKNLEKMHYRLMDQHLTRTLTGPGDTEVGSTAIYDGRLRYNIFKVNYVLKDNTYNKVDIVLENKHGLRLMKIGSFAYKVKRPQNLQSEEGGD